ncbi:hypothetical protein GNI_012870 [Gregarina niphandrodes]|uniref:Uncharacterized protein n=1 Tax=Gregarina niphandrodes TaxID=110365 RepID=A0A023BCH8_GRENI|nr:hypothetical protein GNI_012870 [Gregarina niphandrodes]EZG84451.1 hypothetical protein GNI_012870 [Gregarina niphandrodes]|eukprot:XP_011128866.1 hypothetical protein GNI_012870 [Gregarina niphandrodes]
MRICGSGHNTQWIKTIATFGVSPVGGTPTSDVGSASARPRKSTTGSLSPPRAHPNPVAEGQTPDVRYRRLREQVHQPSVDVSAEPFSEDSTIFSVKLQAEPVGELLAGPLSEACPDLVNEAVRQPWKEALWQPWLRASPETMMEGLSDPWMVSRERLVEAGPNPVMEETSLEPLMGASDESLTEVLRESWSNLSVRPGAEPVNLVAETKMGYQEDSVVTEMLPQHPVAETSSDPFLVKALDEIRPWMSLNLGARMLDECLEMENGLTPILSSSEEIRLMRLAEAAVLRNLRELTRRESGTDRPITDLSITDLSIADFEACSWRWLKLALLMRERQKEIGAFAYLITELEDLVPRPVGLSDTWFLAGVVQRFLSSYNLSNWMLPAVASQSGWGCRKMIFRVSFPGDIVRLPENEDSIKRVCACSKLDWWFRQAHRNIIIDEETWKASERPYPISVVQRALGKRAFDEAIKAMRDVIPSHRELSNTDYLACLLKFAETLPPKQFKTNVIQSRTSRKARGRPNATRGRPNAARGCPNAARGPICSSTATGNPRSSIPCNSNSIPSPSCSSPSVVYADDSVDTKRSVTAEMTGFMAHMLEDCAERERTESEGASLTLEQRGSIARLGLQKFQAALSPTKKSVQKNRQSRTPNPFNSCGWRWLCLVGLMNDNLKPDEVRQLIVQSEKLVPRPEHVSPLWYLACRMQACLRKRWLKARPAWWAVNMTIYQDHFPQTFGELPMSEKSASLIAFSSKTAHWIASGIRRFHLTCKTWSSGANGGIVDIIHKVMGDHWFNEMVNIIKLKICKLTPEEGPEQMNKLPDKAIMEAVLRYAHIGRNVNRAFSNAITGTNSSSDDELLSPKKGRPLD